MPRPSDEYPPPHTVTLPEFLTYSQGILGALSRSGRAFGLLAFAHLLDMAAAEAARVTDETPESNKGSRGVPTP